MTSNRHSLESIAMNRLLRNGRSRSRNAAIGFCIDGRLLSALIATLLLLYRFVL